jgi:hypothetical protein
VSIEKQQYDVLREILDELQETHGLLSTSFANLYAQLQSQGQLLQQIADDLAPEPLTASIANIFTGDSMANNVLVFNVGQTSTDTVTPLLTDGITPSGGVVSNLTVTFSDPSATASVSGANTILFTGVAASAAPVSGSVSCTVTDTDGAVSTWTQAFTVQTNAVVPPSQLTQSIANVFSTPA